MNPALPVGAEGVSLTSRADAWAVTAQVVAGYVPFPSRHAAGRAIDDPTQARLDVGLATLVASFGRGIGFGVEVQLPVGLLATSTVNERRADVGIGDLEARGRFSHRFGRLRLQGQLGLALPTGPYAARSGELAFIENAKYLTLGRGTTWALIDVDARVSLPAALSLFITSTTRLGLADARDGFRWGPEVRGTAGVAWGPVLERLTVSLGLETQARLQSSEVDPFTTERVASVNTGGVWLTATPAVQVRTWATGTVFVAGRLPVWQRTEGLQFIPAAGVFMGVSGSFELPTKPVEAVTPTAGKLTIVDYWASWCAPCRELEPIVAKLEASEGRVAVRRVDASALSPEALEQLVPGAAGLPVVEVFRPDGSRLVRLVGEEVFTLENVVKEALQ